MEIKRNEKATADKIMFRLSGRTKGNCFLVLIWIICAFIDIYYGENYGGIIYKFFVAAVFAVLATYSLLIDLGKVKPIEKKREKWYAIITIIIVIAVAAVVFWNYSVKTNKYNINSNKIPESFDGFRIVQVSDLHNAKFDKYNSSILAPIFHAEPDIIVITGDMIDSRRTDVDVAISFVQKAVNIAPVYYVNGNHESRVPEEYEKLKEGLGKAGVTILENSSADITIDDETITLVGINDPTFRMKLVDDTMKQNIAHQLMHVIPDNNNYKILLAHRPEYFDVYAGNIDLVLSGHAHGGQFIIPFVGGVIAPGQGFMPEYYKDSYIKNGTEMIVSRGIGNSIFSFRINNKPEIIVAELTKIAE